MADLLFDISILDRSTTIIILLGLSTIVVAIVSQFILPLFYFLIASFVSPNISETIQKVVTPYNKLIAIFSGIIFIEIIIKSISVAKNYPIIELFISFILTVISCWLASKITEKFLDVYLLDIAVNSGKQANSELIITGKVIVNLAIIVFGIIIFAQLHQFNILGLLASLGIGGLAIAFAAQKTLEQFLGGVVLYLDQPFKIDDYIGLSDGIFGRVESIGWRSTKIRTSGKGTVLIVPNSSLTQMNIENYTEAKKVMSVINLNFDREIQSQEQALIRQVILASTSDIFGLDSRNTDIAFKSTNQAQITFFILGSSGEESMELRRQLLDKAKQKIDTKLKEYGIEFRLDDSTIYVDAPITI
ncbi:mechanosensitive ion channel family protein [Mastigocoleus testarum]|uniref:Mechanosensitive ion channel protein MscS n=1 Tax=Mastigocoleus testarum BC008 TaxID=371196 RepID=A0A0V7ZNQ4_9CYAN|nr:mechanosensitive ion channel domain-containing protein [Mastigocoleus testarum]KST66352.1 hypothetical protein BC008_25615 [Mastigocoleus testarum BC008]KST66673.1 hypothetical protein BC008_26140 [Mastigocoleus testarum BC008]